MTTDHQTNEPPPNTERELGITVTGSIVVAALVTVGFLVLR
jgi:hypothetical protein